MSHTAINSHNESQLVWVTGAGGLIGSHIVRVAAQFAPGHQTFGLTRSTLDLLDSDSVRSAFRQQKPTAIIHCAAMTRTQDCQVDPKLARRINIESTALLAKLAANIPFFFFSTDLVFDGCKGHYTESDAVNPLNVYGETKVAAEQIVISNPLHTVIRTSLNCGDSPTGDRSFDEQIRIAWERGQRLSFFTDEFRCPIPAKATARACWELLLKRATGLFHVAGSEKLSRAQIGELLAARYRDLNPTFEIGSLKGYVGPARSPDTSLNSSKAQAQLSFALPRFADCEKAGQK
jgi:dTDP-4-dehydrorhamnose reductase